VLQVYAQVGTNSLPAFFLSPPLTSSWQSYTIPLSSLHAANVTNLNRLTFQLTSYGTANAFYLDDIQLTGQPAPALLHLTVNPTQAVRTVDTRWFGVNTAVWDGNFDTPTTLSLLREAGMTILRFPGGSLSDEYHWASNTSLSNNWHWSTSFNNFVHIATNLGAQAFITVNYGTGTAGEAAAWVRSANITNHLGFKYWEIGNEEYGTWETDTNNPPNDGYTYANHVAAYVQQMKAVDPTIKVGVVLTPGEDSSVNGNTTHPATNALTGQVHYGWTPVLLSTLKSLEVTPDFGIYHRYPEYTASGQRNVSDSDPLVLQSGSGWATDASDLRKQIAGYFGSDGTNIELVCTENNSDAGAQGVQSTSLVDGLYYADSLAHVMQTEFNAFVWWDLRNGTDTGGSFDPTLYGWRTNGDLGMIGN
ncbi:MAG: alpha-L-arabinofuranosidase, partial [Limisphaerales bacterium]